MTASVDMFPRQLRRSGRRELLILGISILCYLIGLLLVTEVSRGGAAAELQGEGAMGTPLTFSEPHLSHLLASGVDTSQCDCRDHTVEPISVCELCFSFRNQTQAGLSRKGSLGVE